MGEERRGYVKAIRKILRPDKWKIIVFILLIILMFFLPVYPTEVTEYPGLPSYAEPESSRTVLSPLIFIIMIDFEHDFQENFQPVDSDISTPVYMPTFVSVYKANSSFLYFYCILVPLFYILGCYGVERIRWKKEHVYVKGVKEL